MSQPISLGLLHRFVRFGNKGIFVFPVEVSWGAFQTYLLLITNHLELKKCILSQEQPRVIRHWGALRGFTSSGWGGRSRAGTENASAGENYSPCART